MYRTTTSEVSLSNQYLYPDAFYLPASDLGGNSALICLRPETLGVSWVDLHIPPPLVFVTSTPTPGRVPHSSTVPQSSLTVIPFH